MLKPEHLWWSAARVEIDQRARDARLRLEHLERLLILRVLPTSRPKRVFHRRGLRFFRGGAFKTARQKWLRPAHGTVKRALYRLKFVSR